MKKSIDKQVGGHHYKKHSIQPWHIIDDYGLDYYKGNVLKYLLREKDDEIEDLEKAIHYLERKIELLEIEEETEHTRSLFAEFNDD